MAHRLRLAVTAHKIRTAAPPRSGFTLVEMIVTLVLFGIMAATLTIFFKPALDTWLAARSRSALAADADNAMRRMLREVQVAVPNSIRTPATNCVELVPTSGGGRYRMGIDTTLNGAAAVDPAAATTSFDVLSPLSSLPASGDWVVVDNQNPGDVYSGANRTALTSVASVAATLGRHRLGVAAWQFPLGYDGGRFNIVPAAQQAVFYVCSGASSTLDANGDAPGVLVRLKHYGFNAAAPGACPATTGGDVVAGGLRSCRFLFSANQGATQQSGFVSVQLEFTRNNETASLVFGAHVDNVP
jgi:MSHA biogenesis protein MshO